MSPITATTTSGTHDVDRPQAYEIYIRCTPERLWEAITSPDFTSRYFFGTRVQTNGVPGQPFVYHAPDGSCVMVDGEVLVWEPPRRLVHTWRSLYDPECAAEPYSRISWHIESEADVCRLRVTHDLTGAPNTAANVAGGWMRVLSGLKTVLETGGPMATLP